MKIRVVLYEETVDERDYTREKVIAQFDREVSDQDGPTIYSDALAVAFKVDGD